MSYQVNQLPHAIPIGVQTEKGVESVGFVVSAWQSEYGVMEFSVWATRPGEDIAYEVKNTELVGSILYWYPDEVDTSIAGVGKVEVKGTTGDKRKLSGFCETVVQPSTLAHTQDPPQVVIPWLEDIKESAEEAKQHADRAEEIADNLTGGAITGAVRFDKPQQLTDEQKAQARENIGAGTGSGGGIGDGTPGEDGGYYIPTVTDGILAWKPSKDDMPEAPEAEIRGPKGEAATIRIGTVTTLSPGSKATVRNSGTDTDAVFDFGIPRGADGAGGTGSGGAGTPGEDGGYYLPTVTDGILSWEASRDDMPQAPSADIRGPKGDKGDPGQPGANGEPGYTPKKGVDYFDGAPGTPGTSVTVKSVTQNTDDGGVSVVTFSDGKTLQVKNGAKGGKGDPGEPGQPGVPGDPGLPGYSPVRGVDYWTAQDKQTIVNDVLAALPAAEGVSF